MNKLLSVYVLWIGLFIWGTSFAPDNKDIHSASEASGLILKLFQTDIQKSPDKTFSKPLIEKNALGETIETYIKKLEYPESNIFTYAVVYIKKGKSGKSKTVVFETRENNALRTDDIKKLVDNIYYIYGEDTNGKGLLKAEEFNAFKKSGSYARFQRSWGENRKRYYYPLYINNLGNKLSLRITDLPI